MIRLNLILIILLISLIPGMASASLTTQPDYVEVGEVAVLEDVVDEGDAIIIISYNIHYITTAIPANPIEEEFAGVIDRDGDTTGMADQLSTQLYGGSGHPYSGYRRGTYGLYLTAEQNSTRNDNSVYCILTVPGEGNSASNKCIIAPGSGTGNTVWNNKNLVIFKDALFAQVKDMENSLNKSLVNETNRDAGTISSVFHNEDTCKPPAENSTACDMDAQSYFTSAIQLLDEISYSGSLGLFATNQVLPLSTTKEDFSISNDHTTFLSGSDFDQSPTSGSPFAAMMEWTNMSGPVLGTVITVLMAGAIGFAVVVAVGKSEIGLFAAIIVMVVSTRFGIMPMSIMALLSFMGVLALGYIFFYKGSTT